MRIVAPMVAAAFATAAAALAVRVVYAPGPLPGLLCASALAGTAVTTWLRARRLPPTAALSVALVVLAGGVVALGAWLPRPEGALLGSTLEAVRFSGARILTTSVPVPVTLETVVLPVCGTWLAGAVCATLLTSRHSGYAVVPPVLLFGGAIALVGPSRAPAYASAVAMVAALVVLLALVEQRAIARLRRASTMVFAVMAAAAVALAGPLVVAVTGDHQPPDLRNQVEPPYLRPTQVHPLSLLGGWAAEPDEELLEVETDQPVPLRWVVLSEFTGVTWLPAERYRAAGALLTADPVAAGAVPTSHDVTVTGLPGGWLPAPIGVREVRGARVAIDDASATLVAPEGLTPGLQYTVEGATPLLSPDRLATARLPTSEEFDAYRQLPPGRPGRLDEIAQLAAGTGQPYQQASRLSAYLRENYRFDPEAPGGSGYPSLSRFLDPGAAGAGRGTSEQFATAFATLARSLGMPSRVVVGFAPGEPVGDGSFRVRTGDVRAWAEVYFEDLGWVMFDPTPSTTAEDPSRAGGSNLLPGFPPELANAGESAEPTLAPQTDPADGDPDPPETAAGSGEPSTSTRWRGWWLMIPAVLLGFAAAVPVLRWRRSTVRLGRGGPADRLLGGWAEVRDGLRMRGWRLGPAQTVEEVAGLALAATGGEAVRVTALASAVNEAAFGGFVSPETEVDELVAGVRAYRRALRRRAGWLRRVTWWLDLRPLWWR